MAASTTKKKSKARKKSAAEQTEPAMDFEAVMGRLSEIVEQLEDSELSLEQSLELFEEGMKLTASSQLKLEQAEKRVEELLTTADGEVQVAELEDA